MDDEKEESSSSNYDSSSEYPSETSESKLSFRGFSKEKVFEAKGRPSFEFINSLPFTSPKEIREPFKMQNIPKADPLPSNLNSHNPLYRRNPFTISNKPKNIFHSNPFSKSHNSNSSIFQKSEKARPAQSPNPFSNSASVSNNPFSGKSAKTANNLFAIPAKNMSDPFSNKKSKPSKNPFSDRTTGKEPKNPFSYSVKSTSNPFSSSYYHDSKSNPFVSIHIDRSKAREVFQVNTTKAPIQNKPKSSRSHYDFTNVFAKINNSDSNYSEAVNVFDTKCSGSHPRFTHCSRDPFSVDSDEGGDGCREF